MDPGISLISEMDVDITDSLFSLLVPFEYQSGDRDIPFGAKTHQVTRSEPLYRWALTSEQTTTHQNQEARIGEHLSATRVEARMSMIRSMVTLHISNMIKESFLPSSRTCGGQRTFQCPSPGGRRVIRMFLVRLSGSPLNFCGGRTLGSIV